MTVPPQTGTQLCLSRVRAGFQNTTIVNIDHLEAAAGEFISIAGPSGCGKSTLLRVIAGLLMPQTGTVNVVRPANDRSPRTGFVFQDATLLPWLTAAANIRLPGDLEHCPVSRDRVEELATFVGLSVADLRKRPAALSGGMKMRVSLARALALQPDLLLLDEPFAALDDLLRQQLQADVLRIHNELQLTTVLVTHNVAEAVFMSDRVITLGGTPAQITSRTDIRLDRHSEIRSSAEFSAQVGKITAALRNGAVEIPS